LKHSQAIRRLCTGVVLAFFLAKVVPLGATAILAFWRPDRIYIAGDSAAVGDNDVPLTEPVCKVFPGKHVAMAVAGDVAGTMLTLDRKTDKVVGRHRWDFLALADRISKTAATPREALELFEKEGKDDIALVIRKSKDTVGPLSVLAAGFPEGKPQIVIVDYIRQVDKNGDLSAISNRTVCPIDCPVDNTPFELGMVDRNLRQRWLALPRAIAADPVRASNALLTQQRDFTAKKYPGAVAAPFDILEMSAKGMVWRQHKRQCRELPRISSLQ